METVFAGAQLLLQNFININATFCTLSGKLVSAAVEFCSDVLIPWPKFMDNEFTPINGFVFLVNAQSNAVDTRIKAGIQTIHNDARNPTDPQRPCTPLC